jgi:hypothetical protein
MKLTVKDSRIGDLPRFGLSFDKNTRQWVRDVPSKRGAGWAIVDPGSRQLVIGEPEGYYYEDLSFIIRMEKNGMFEEPQKETENETDETHE